MPDKPGPLRTLGQEFRYLRYGLTPPWVFAWCLWKAIRRRLGK